MSILSLDTARESRAARVEPTRVFAEAYNAFTVTTAKYPTDIVQLAGNVSAGIRIALRIAATSGQFDNPPPAPPVDFPIM